MSALCGWAARPDFDISGKQFGRWLVVGRTKNLDGQVAWLCRCDCGREKVIRGSPLRTGRTLSCGCYAAEQSGKRNRKHGMRGTGTYKSWDGLKQRCLNPSCDCYARYGGRGITVCARWLESFENFLADMGKKPRGMSIDRIDNDGHYEPGNCRWATSKQQARNRRSNAVLTAFGESKPLAEWLEDKRCTVTDHCIRERLAAGWAAPMAIGLPALPRHLRRFQTSLARKGGGA